MEEGRASTNFSRRERRRTRWRSTTESTRIGSTSRYIEDLQTELQGTRYSGKLTHSIILPMQTIASYSKFMGAKTVKFKNPQQVKRATKRKKRPETNYGTLVASRHWMSLCGCAHNWFQCRTTPSRKSRRSESSCLRRRTLNWIHWDSSLLTEGMNKTTTTDQYSCEIQCNFYNFTKFQLFRSPNLQAVFDTSD